MLPALRDRLQRRLDALRRRVRRIRAFRFRDCRVILEQEDEVSYFIVTAGLQRRVARTMMTTSLLAIGTILTMLSLNSALSAAKFRLERSHADIYHALMDNYDASGAGTGQLDEERMLAIATTIRERNSDIQRFVDRSLESITGQNAELATALRDSGLTGQAIRIIQDNMPIGGTSGTLSPSAPRPEVKALAEAMAKNQSLHDVLSALPDHLPLDAASITSGFGLRTHPFTGKPQFHTGVDLVPSSGLSIHPAMAGKVVLATYGQELGNTVVVSHGNGIQTLYGHMASIAVQNGQEVTEASVLGVVGNTGTASTGRHLHFEVTVGGYPVNPLKVIRTAQDVRKVATRE